MKKNDKRGTRAALAALLFAAVAGNAQAAGELHIYNWSDYIAEDTIAKFEKETGIKVTYDVYDSNEVLQSKLSAGNTGYDVVVPTSNFLGKQIEAGIHQKLDKSKLPNWKNLDPDLLKRLESVDPGNQYAVPYLWGTNGIGINLKKVKEVLGDDFPTDSYDLIFKPEYMQKLAKCGVTFLDSPSEVFPVVLNYLKLDPNSLNEKDYTGPVYKLMESIKPYIRYFHSSQYINDLASGEVCVVYGWSGDVGIAKTRAEEAKNGVELDYVIPKEGTALWFDNMVIPKGAKNVEAAHLWLNFIMRPEIIADVTNFVTYPNANKASKPLVSAELRDDPKVYPTPDIMERVFTISPKPASIDRVMTRVWTRIKTGH